MAVLTVRRPPNPLVYSSAAGGGDSFPNGGREILHARNASGGSLRVAVASSAQCNQGFTHNVEYTVAAGEDAMLGPFDVARYGSSVGLTYPDGVTSLTVAAIGWI